MNSSEDWYMLRYGVSKREYSERLYRGSLQAGFAAQNGLGGLSVGHLPGFTPTTATPPSLPYKKEQGTGLKEVFSLLPEDYIELKIQNEVNINTQIFD